MTIKKVFLHLVIFISLLTVAGLSNAAVTIQNPLGTTDTIPKLLVKIAKGAGELIASLGGVMITVAGFLFMTAAGNPEKINKAKVAMTYAIIGIFIGLLAEAIANTIIAIMTK